MRGFVKATHAEDAPAKNVRAAVIRRLGGYLWRYKFFVLLILLMMLASNLMALAAPMLSGKAINLLADGEGTVDLPSVAYYCILMALCYIFSALLSYLLAIMTTTLSKKIVYTMRKQVFDKLMELPVSFFDTHAKGDIISHISYDIDVVNVSLSHDLLQVLTSLVTVVGSLVMMISIAPVLIVIFLFTVPASILFAKWKTKRARPLFKKRSQSLGHLNGYAEEMLSGHKTVKAYGREDIILSRFDQKNEEAVNAYYKADLQGAYMGPVVNFINNLSISLVAMLGGIFYMLTVTQGPALPVIFRISLGDIGSFIQYSRKFSGPINEFANILHDLQSACAAAERVFHILDEAPEKPDDADAEELRLVRGNLSIEHIRFGYVPKKTIIENLDLEVKAGETIAIVGPTGAGKTTVINLLMRFYDADSGTIRIDGKDICRVTRDSLRKAYTMVLQDTWLFYGTIFENITYGKENATREEVVRAAKAARIHSYIESLPKGYDTILSDDGTSISKGQKQLITIARAMLSDAPLLILDEATSNVDSRTEIQIQEAMNSLMQNRTCFVIAHRLSTVQNADKILVFKDGNVIEQGHHNELMQKGGFYASLYNSQFAK
ncbi:MAG: ABC transporter ATP-binding protein [Clostridia bacterium]|nr:ABC transporter ATP-binding protein [Clostridia bacterium]